MKKMKWILGAACIGALASSTNAVGADPVKPSYEASPDVYKILAENDEVRVILATWKPGQKDKVHSHPKAFGAYTIKGCNRRLTKADGSVIEGQVKPGTARVRNQAVKAHTFENLSNTECQQVLFEVKK